MDDIIIPSRDRESGLKMLKIVLNTAATNGLKIKWKKCQFLQKKVEYLGSIIENGTIQPARQKLKAVENFPIPKSLKHIQSFLGLTGFFRKFIENYAIKSAPLSDLLKKETEFIFGEKQQIAFEGLKKCLISPPILHLFDPEQPTELHTDASKLGYGAILFQTAKDDQVTSNTLL